MNKYEKVYYDIKDKIKNGIIKPGDFLKKEDDLAKDYNFSKFSNNIKTIPGVNVLPPPATTIENFFINNHLL